MKKGENLHQNTEKGSENFLRLPAKKKKTNKQNQEQVAFIAPQMIPDRK